MALTRILGERSDQPLLELEPTLVFGVVVPSEGPQLEMVVERHVGSELRASPGEAIFQGSQYERLFEEVADRATGSRRRAVVDWDTLQPDPAASACVQHKVRL